MTYEQAVQRRDDRLAGAKRMYNNLRPAFAETFSEPTIDSMLASMEDSIVVISDGKGRYSVGAIDRYGNIFKDVADYELIAP